MSAVLARQAKSGTWALVPLKDLGQWAGGGTPSKAKAEFWANGTVPWVSPKDMKRLLIAEAEDYITEAAIRGSAAKLISAKSVLVVTRSGILSHTLPVAITIVPVAINQDLKALTPKEGVLPEYVAWALRCFSREILKNCSKQGTTVSSIETNALQRFEIPVPSLEEQKKVVAEIEKQLSRLDEAVANLKRVKANLKRYKASVLKAAVEGRLVETEAEIARREGREYETGEQFLEHILKARRKLWQGKGKYKEPSAPDTVGLPVLPTGWVWIAAEQVCSTIASGSTPPAGEMYTDRGEIPFLKVYNLTFDGSLDFTIKPTFIKRVTHEGRLNRSRVRPGDVLTNIVGPPLGKVSIAPDSYAEWNINQAIVAFRPIAPITNRLLAIWMISTPVQERLARTAKATAGQFNLQVTTCRKLALPLPPSAEQQRIVAEVDRRLSFISGIETQVDADLQRSDSLRQSILASAFSGKWIAVEQPQREKEHANVPANVRHFSRAVLSAEIVHRLHNEPAFGRVKHQKIFHLCEYIAQLDKLQGEYKRKAAGPLDNKLIYANESELKRQQWYQTVLRQGKGHKYVPLEKAGSHQKYLDRYWPESLDKVSGLIELMRSWTTERCEIFSTAYAAWNDLLIWGVDATDEAILDEILNRWNESKKRIPESQWKSALRWMRDNGYAPVGFGNPTGSKAGGNKSSG